jgi:hypothetical protein
MPWLVAAQQSDLGTTTQTNQGERRVAASEKMVQVPETIDTLLPFDPINHPYVTVYLDINYTPEPIRPAKLKVVDPLDKLRNGYVKAGVGMYTSPFLDVYYMSGRDRNKSLAANYRHFSAWDGLRNHSYSRFSDNHLSLDGKYLLKNLVLKGGLTGDANTLFFYSVPDSLLKLDSTAFGKKDLRQRLNSLRTRWSLNSYFEDSTRVNYMVYLDYGVFADNKDTRDSLKFDYAREHTVEIGTSLSKYHNREKFRIDASLDFNHYHPHVLNPDCPECDKIPSTLAWNNGIFKLVPSVSTGASWWSLRAGFGIFADLPQYSTQSARFFFWPDAEFRANLFNNILVPYVGVDGSLRRNNFRSLTGQNPYLLSGVELRNSVHKIRVYGGMRGSLSSSLTFNVGVSHGTVADMALFVTDTTYSYNNRFAVEYDTVQRTEIYGQLAFFRGEKIRLNLNGSWFFNDALSEARAWNLPQYKFSFTGSYNLGDKLIASLEAYVIGGRYGRRYTFAAPPPGDENYVVKLDDFVDVNVQLEYRYSKRLSGYFRVSNMVSRKYQLWLDHPAWGINVHGGITWAF